MPCQISISLSNLPVFIFSNAIARIFSWSNANEGIESIGNHLAWAASSEISLSAGQTIHPNRCRIRHYRQSQPALGSRMYMLSYSSCVIFTQSKSKKIWTPNILRIFYAYYSIFSIIRSINVSIPEVARSRMWTYSSGKLSSHGLNIMTTSWLNMYLHAFMLIRF